MGTLAAFAADLANRPEPALRKLLLLRPDALNPPVPTFVALAARLSTASCISRALDALNAPALQHLGTGPWNAQTSPNSSLMPELYARGLLLLQTDNQTDDAGTGHYMHAPYVLPLALVPNPQMPSSTLPPEPVVRAVTEAVCKNAAGSAADALLRSVDTLADLAAHTPLQALRSGQFAARTVRLVAQNLETDELHTHFLLDLCATAGLLTFQTSTRDWRWAAPWWSELERQEQWVGLIRSWLSSPATAGEPALTSSHHLCHQLCHQLCLALRDRLSRGPEPEFSRGILFVESPAYSNGGGGSTSGITHPLGMAGSDGRRGLQLRRGRRRPERLVTGCERCGAALACGD